MATNVSKSICHHNSLRRRHHSTTTSPPFFLKPTTNAAAATAGVSLSLSHASTFSVSSATFSTPTTDPSTSRNVSFDLLHLHLSNKDFLQADEETRRLIIVLAGDAAQKRGYVYFSEVQFIPEDALRAIDELWRQHSGDKFGYSVQKKIWQKVDRDFTRFFIKVGWMKKLESSEVEHYNYRSFPSEFTWEMEEKTMEGHLPLTNALRGTQLLSSILSHKAFQVEEDEEEGEEEVSSSSSASSSNRKSLLSTTFKANYTF